MSSIRGLMKLVEDENKKYEKLNEYMVGGLTSPAPVGGVQTNLPAISPPQNETDDDEGQFTGLFSSPDAWTRWNEYEWETNYDLQNVWREADPDKTNNLIRQYLSQHPEMLERPFAEVPFPIQHSSAAWHEAKGNLNVGPTKKWSHGELRYTDRTTTT